MASFFDCPCEAPSLPAPLSALICAERKHDYERRRDLIFTGIAVIYTLFLIYAAGMKYLLLAAILYAPGTVLYF